MVAPKVGLWATKLVELTVEQTVLQLDSSLVGPTAANLAGLMVFELAV
jgi:hypothetical protein